MSEAIGVIVLVLIVGGVVVLIDMALRASTQSQWQGFAESNGLQFRPSRYRLWHFDDTPDAAITGQLRSRSVVYEYIRRGLHEEGTPWNLTRLRMSVRNPSGCALSVRRRAFFRDDGPLGRLTSRSNPESFGAYVLTDPLVRQSILDTLPSEILPSAKVDVTTRGDVVLTRRGVLDAMHLQEASWALILIAEHIERKLSPE